MLQQNKPVFHFLILAKGRWHPLHQGAWWLQVSEAADADFDMLASRFDKQGSLLLERVLSQANCTLIGYLDAASVQIFLANPTLPPR